METHILETNKKLLQHNTETNRAAIIKAHHDTGARCRESDGKVHRVAPRRSFHFRFHQLVLFWGKNGKGSDISARMESSESVDTNEGGLSGHSLCIKR